jgi:hypothetical protein
MVPQIYCRKICMYVAAPVHAAQRSRCLLEIVAAIKYLGHLTLASVSSGCRIKAFSSHFCAFSSRLEGNAMRPNWTVAE